MLFPQKEDPVKLWTRLVAFKLTNEKYIESTKV